jgi:hypothetical protein|tara:strand:+ start:742 stop:1071 length:330 start_codon:yes stop_codon:yes gene_type:complete
MLPPIGNRYYTSINIPLIGTQNVKYERTKKLISELTLSGKVNKQGYIYFDNKDSYKYTLDNTLENILKKYKCSLSDPLYDNINDVITLNIRINLIRFSKELTLINDECL